jgi:transcriptional antiterminator RfaH
MGKPVKQSERAIAERKRQIEAASRRYGDTVVAWYPVYCGVAAEEVAAENLRLQGYAAFYPKIKVHHRRKRQNVKAFIEEQVERPYYPRYIFVGIRDGQDQGIMPINETQGVSTVVYFGERPLSIPGKYMNRLMLNADSDGIVARIDKRNKLERRLYQKHDLVRLSDESPFEGIIAMVSVDLGTEIKILLDLFGAQREVTIVPGHVAEVIAAA